MKYWLYTDDDPNDDYEDWGIFKFRDITEDDEADTAEVTEVIFSSGDFGVGDYEEMWEDSVEDGQDSRSQRRILTFLLSYGEDF